MLTTTELPVVATARGDLNILKEEILRDTGINHERLIVLKLDATGRLPRHSYPSYLIDLLGR